MATATKPLVSVIITCYNKKKWIKRAIESVLSQKTKFDYEILIIDDKSTDGSIKILEQYQAQHPDKIKLYKNPKNLGITKTWIKICKKAKGQWIARLDGDDYWVDDQKLQKQIDLLAQHPESKWCNTDFDMADTKGNIVFRNCFTNQVIPLPDSYEMMLVSKGFTSASTWVIETTLMTNVNNDLNPNTSDDTFDIQLELFQKTQLLTLYESTAVYSCLETSDSHPSINQYRKRCEKLLETQKQFIKKYPKADFIKMLELSLNKYKEWEIKFYAQKPTYEELLYKYQQLEQEMKKLLQSQQQLQKSIANIYNSTSWKLTKPIRKIKRINK